MIKDIQDIKSICELGLTNFSGIRSLSFTDVANMSVLGHVAPGSTVYKVDFRRFTGELTDDYNSSRAGDYYIKRASIFVQRYRAAAERIIEELKDRKVVVFVKDNNNVEHRIDYAIFSSKFTTGKSGKDAQGYEWTFEGVDRRIRFFADASLNDLTGDVYTPPAPDNDDVGPAPDPESPPGVNYCCVTILLTPIPEAPLPTGNILYRGKFVTTLDDGSRYFIDKNGNSIQLGGANIVRERVEGDGSYIYALSETFDPDKVLVNRTQNVLYRVDGTPTAIDTFDIQGGDLILPSDWPLESGEYIELYQIN